MVSCSVSVASCSGHWINCQSTCSVDLEQKARILEYSQLSTRSIDIGQKARILEYSQLSTCSTDIRQKAKILEYSQLSTRSIDIGQKAKILEYSQLSTCSTDIRQKAKILEYSQLLCVCDVLLLAVLNGQTVTTSAQNAKMAMYSISTSSCSGHQTNLTQAYTQCSSHIKVKGKRQE